MEAAAAECIPTKLRAKHRVPWENIAVRKKRDNVKTASLCNKKNPINANIQEAQRELFNAYPHQKKKKKKEKNEYIEGQINKIRNSVEEGNLE